MLIAKEISQSKTVLQKQRDRHEH